jgi:hypothetical protein
VSPKITTDDGNTIDYRLHQLGIRVWADACQLISRSGATWVTLGPQRRLPVIVPRDENALVKMDDLIDALVLTAYQYHTQQPGSDIVDVLGQRKLFVDALAELR